MEFIVPNISMAVRFSEGQTFSSHSELEIQLKEYIYGYTDII